MPSSHSSSSHSSSSFSSSSSSHSSFSSSHSYSSHSSSFDSDERIIPSREVKQYVMPSPRSRSNQPSGLNGSVSSSSLIRSVNHDYVYFPDIWTDSATKKRYEKGYYDEKGRHYKQIIIKDGDKYETRAECSFCGTQIKLKWTKGAMPSCPNCGAALKEMVDQSIIEEKLKPKYKTVRVPISAQDDGYFVNGQHISKSKVDDTFLTGGRSSYYEEKRPFDSSVLIVPGIFISVLLFGFIVFIMNRVGSGSKTTTISPTRILTVEEQIEYYSTYTAHDPTATPTPVPGYFFKFIANKDFPDTIYVDAIGRECSWHSSGNYYDPVTDCYFWLNDTVSPPIWQYWYEGISSDYGDYGWMEYDFKEKRWYIEASKGNWIVLPDKYDQSKLWHMQTSDDGRYRGWNSIYVPELGRHCEYIELESCYYDPETKCHFYYDTYTAEPAWVYWFEDFKKEEGIGWLKYNMQDEHWYVENGTRWFKLENYVYDFDKYTWHFKKQPTNGS